MRDDEAVEGMEAALVRMADILRKRDAELLELKQTVSAECDERGRLLARVHQLQQAQAGAPASAPPAKAALVEPEPASWQAAAGGGSLALGGGTRGRPRRR